MKRKLFTDRELLQAILKKILKNKGTIYCVAFSTDETNVIEKLCKAEQAKQGDIE